MRVIVVKNYEEVSAKASRFVLSELWRKPNLVLGLATGATPIGLYKNLIKAYKEKRADFSDVKTFNLDEYWGISEKAKESYHYFMKSNLFSQINIKRENTNIPPSKSESAEIAGENFERDIKQSGGIDLQVLGIGSNGHIGFCEPGTSFDSRTHLAKLSEETRVANSKYFSSFNKIGFEKKTSQMPTHAITMGLGTIMEAKKILLLASGKNKAKAVAEAIEGPVSTRVPASILQWHSDATIILDEEAAFYLKSNYKSPLLFAEGDIELLTKNDLPRKKSIVVISPHPDDASISLGGTISMLSKNNKVFVAVMTTGYRSVVSGKSIHEIIKIRENEAKDESKVLGTKAIFLRSEFYDAKNFEDIVKNDIKKLLNNFEKIKPDIIFLPNKKDSHPTHKISRDVALSCVEKYKKIHGGVFEIWEFEGPWSMFGERDFNTIVAYGDDILKNKMRAISLQKSQIERTRFDIAAKSLSQLRASVVPEQAMVGYGAKSPNFGKYFELFRISSV